MTPAKQILSPLLLLTALLAGCSTSLPRIIGSASSDGPPDRRLDPNAIPDAIPRYEPKSKRGNPSSYVVGGRRYYVMSSSRGFVERGIASWYGAKFHGRLTSSGEPYNMYAMTAAHKSLPLPTYVQVTNLRNGRQVIVKVNDRGPFHGNRIIDLSYAAAAKLGILAKGTGLVEVRALNPADPRPHSRPEPAMAKRPLETNPDIFIQVGAFTSRYNADKLRSQLRQVLKRTIRIQESLNRGRPIFRVQVGPLTTIAQVDRVTMTLGRLGIKESHLIIE